MKSPEEIPINSSTHAFYNIYYHTAHTVTTGVW